MNFLKLTLNTEINLKKSNLGLGFGLFETIKIEENKPVLLDEHLTRLEKSLSTFNLGKLPDFNEIRGFIGDFLNSEHSENKALKLIAVDGKLIVLLRACAIPESNVSINISKKVRNSGDILTRHKTTSYFFNKLLMEESKEKKVYETLSFNELGFLTEGGKTNVFVIKNNLVFTPRLEDGILSGIIRKQIINKTKVIEKTINKEFLQKSDEIFLTNSLIGLRPVSNIIGYEKEFSDEQALSLKKKLNL